MTADAAVEDYAVLAGVQGVLVEILERRNADLERRVGELPAQLAATLERIAKLVRQASRNSGNCGMPPWADDLPGRTAPDPKPERERGGKKRQGKQPRAYLAWSDDPGDKKPLFPRGECDCGRDLDDAIDLGVARSHQVIDAPAVTASVI